MAKTMLTRSTVLPTARKALRELINGNVKITMCYDFKYCMDNRFFSAAVMFEMDGLNVMITIDTWNNTAGVRLTDGYGEYWRNLTFSRKNDKKLLDVVEPCRYLN